jgi:hypothetical protein
MKTKQLLTLFLLITTVLVLTACGGAQDADTTTEDPVSQEDQISQIYTQAAETLQAEIALTEAAAPTSTPTVQASPTPVTLATNTPLPALESPTPLPTLPALPSPTLIPTKAASVAGRPCLRAELLWEKPVDGTVLKPGQSFIKYWNFANAGECDWNANFSLIHVGGPNFSDNGSYNLVDISNMDDTGIPNGGKLEIQVSMEAPSSPGTYKSLWMLRSEDNQWFGVGALGDEVFWLEIVVRQ